MTDIAGPSSAELAAIIEGRTAEEIAASIARHVRQAPLSADTPLPTVRGLATELGVSASTVSDAWRILRARGVIYTVDMERDRDRFTGEARPFLSGRPFPITDIAFRQAWDRLRRRADITDLTFHDLRHEAISRLFESGLKIHEVMAISGHKTASQLFRYVQVANQNL